jgi:hypothetical protein
VNRESSQQAEGAHASASRSLRTALLHRDVNIMTLARNRLLVKIAHIVMFLKGPAERKERSDTDER